MLHNTGKPTPNFGATSVAKGEHLDDVFNPTPSVAFTTHAE
jgi:hypothetical protein